jgi:cytochrome b
VRVWDPAVRLFHWALVLAVLVAGWTGVWVGDRAITPHVMVGIGVGALVMARLVWGFCGGRFARFQGFVVGPVALMQHVRDLAQGHAARHLGHNPLGGAMIVVLLAALASLVATGLAVWGGVFRAGPLTTYLSVDAGERLLTLHGWIAYGLFGLVAAHVLGALGESLRTSENLAGAMVTGRKERRAFDHAPAEVTAQPFVALAMVVAGLRRRLGTWRIAGSASGARCAGGDRGQCLRVAMFGLSCGLSPLALACLELAGADGGSWRPFRRGCLASRSRYRSRHRLPDCPCRRDDGNAGGTCVPHGRSGRALHHHRNAVLEGQARSHLPEALFKAPAVATKANCAACHGDAGTGWFYPGNINIPCGPDIIEHERNDTMKHWHKALVLAGTVTAAGAAWAAPAAVQALIDGYAAAGGANFSADAGKALFQGQPYRRQCRHAVVHHVPHDRSRRKSATPARARRSRRWPRPCRPTGSPTRPRSRKWFGRNCNTVLGRECTAQEKGDILTYLSEPVTRNEKETIMTKDQSIRGLVLASLAVAAMGCGAARAESGEEGEEGGGGFAQMDPTMKSRMFGLPYGLSRRVPAQGKLDADPRQSAQALRRGCEPSGRDHRADPRLSHGPCRPVAGNDRSGQPAAQDHRAGLVRGRAWTALDQTGEGRSGHRLDVQLRGLPQGAELRVGVKAVAHCGCLARVRCR